MKNLNSKAVASAVVFCSVKKKKEEEGGGRKGGEEKKNQKKRSSPVPVRPTPKPVQFQFWILENRTVAEPKKH